MQSIGCVAGALWALWPNLELPGTGRAISEGSIRFDVVTTFLNPNIHNTLLVSNTIGEQTKYETRKNS